MSRRLRLSIQRKDRLSSLPDEILENIISFLSTKDAVTTCFLSKRWKSLWRSQLNNLHFDDKTFQDPFAFRQFLISVITKRDNTIPIHSFHLNSHHNYDIDFYDFVYSSAITGGVQNLSSINLCSIRTILPTFVLSTKTLSVLKLKGISLNEISYDDDPCFDLPSLKLLHLESVAFTFHKHIRKLLLSACPILEELKIKDLIVMKRSSELHTNRHGSIITNLVRANISSENIDLNWLRNVQHLRINLEWNCFLRPKFHNLIHIELIFDFCYPDGLFEWSWLMKLLKNSPKLQTLIIDEVDTVHNYGDREWKDPEIIPECLLSHLKTCSLRNYRHTNCWFRFAKYIMQNSRVLSTMTILSARHVDTNTKLQMLRLLSLCPRNSATCKLLFI